MSLQLTGAEQVWIPALLIAVGMVGIVVPVLPGLLLTLLAVLLWAWSVGGTGAWVVFGICVIWFAAGVTGQYLIPGKRLKAEGVGTGQLVIAVVTGLVMIFVIPIVGFFVGFVGALFLMAWNQSHDLSAAWRRTRSALRAVLTSVGIELLAAVAIALTWTVGVLVH